MHHSEEDLTIRWLKLRIKLKERFGIKPDVNGVLMLIGVQELGQCRRNSARNKSRT